MQAKETKFQDVIEGTKQYVIPLFQRQYSWESKEWDVLWRDIVELCELDQPRTHFIGSIVNMPTVSVPEGVAKYLLIDGQQRLTTIFVILMVLRDRAKLTGMTEFAAEINDTLLVNPFKKDTDRYKLMPTQGDREVYTNLIESREVGEGGQISKAYTFFEKKLRQVTFDPQLIKKIITSYFSVVSIVLDSDDNPYLVFESLNAKGKPLTAADLIRNYFFMRIHVDEQDAVYAELWRPMQEGLGENLTEFIRHFLMKEGAMVKQSDVYFALKDRVSPSNVTNYLRDLKRNSKFYERLVYPEQEPNPDLKKYFLRLNRIEVTTAYPLLLPLYSDYDSGKLSLSDFVEILKTIENYLIRRFVCSVPTHQLNKTFLPLYSQISKSGGTALGFIKAALQTKGYPKDTEFQTRFKETRLYGAGERQIKTKLILESIEEYEDHKETVPFEDLSIEHILPQTPTDSWKLELGEDWEDTHEFLLHTIGNLTLTAYNSELSNDNFAAKKQLFSQSHLSLNNYFNRLEHWGKDEIEERAQYLAEIALKIWGYFGDETVRSPMFETPVAQKPASLMILGQESKVTSWRDVLEQTLNTIIDLEPEKFEVIAQNFPRYLGREKSRFKNTRLLQNGYFVEVNLSSKSINRFCENAISLIDLTSEDWWVTLA